MKSHAKTLIFITYHNKKNDDYEDIYSANPLYQIIGKAGEHTEEKNGNKYWTFLNS